MKRMKEITDCDCYLSIDIIRGFDRISLCCVKETSEKYYVAEDYGIYDGEITFEDAVYSWPFSKRKPAQHITKRKYCQLVEKIEAIKFMVLNLPTEGRHVCRESLKTGDCIKEATGFMKFISMNCDEFEASGLSIDKWGARYCDSITGSLSEHLPKKVLLIDEKELLHAEEILRSSVGKLKDNIIQEFKKTR